MEQLENKIQQLQEKHCQKEALEQEKKKNKSLESKLETNRNKLLTIKMQLIDDFLKKGYIDLQPIKGHKFSEFIVSFSVRFYIDLNIGLRGVVKILSILKETLNWEFEAVPNFNTIENWVKKAAMLFIKNHLLI